MSELTFPKMNPKIKRAWVKALRSGKYRRGTGSLEKRDNAGLIRNCCLGVLCRVEGLKPLRPAAKPGKCAVFPGRKIGYLPKSLARGAGVPMDVQVRLAENMNDAGWSFKRIATWIEKHL